MRTDAVRRSGPSHVPLSRRLPPPRPLLQAPPHLATPARLATHRARLRRSWSRTPLERRVDDHAVPPVVATHRAPAWPRRGLALLATLVLVALVLVAARGVVALSGWVGASMSGWAAVASAPPTSPDGTSTPDPTPPLASPIATDPGTSVGAVLLNLDGDGIATTPLFETDGSWMIEWRHPGPGLFSLRLVPATQETFGIEVDSWLGPTTGRQPMYDAAAYHLQIMASDQWSVVVEDVASVEPLGLPVRLTGSGPSNSPLLVGAGRWLLEWTVDPVQALGVEVYRSGEDAPVLVVDSIAGSAGCAEFDPRGEFYLHVMAHGAWTVTLTELSGEVVCPTR